jgi:hypothetical protein
MKKEEKVKKGMREWIIYPMQKKCINYHATKERLLTIKRKIIAKNCL